MNQTLISVSDIKGVTSISKSIETLILEPYILIAEEFFVYNTLGDALVTELKEQIATSGVTQLNQTLLDNYISLVVAYGAWHEYIPFSATKTTVKGEMSQSSTDSASATLDELTFKRQAIKDKVTFFQHRLEKYLNENASSYPLYRSVCPANTSYGSTIWLGRN